MIKRNHVFRLPTSGLYCSANRYIPDEADRSGDGLTVVLAHCASAHKEQWEPTIRRLYELTSKSVAVRDVWALDCQNHGDSAVLNERALDPRDPVSVEEYGDLLCHFLQSEYVRGRRVVAVGHSASASAWLIACTRFSSIPLEAIIFIEPVVLTPPIVQDDERVVKGLMNVKAVLARRDRWEDIDSAKTWMRSRYPWKTWDQRVFETYLDHGFKSVEDAGGSGHVTPKCPKEQEAGFYNPEPYIGIGATLHEICVRVPIHCLFGERSEMVTQKSRESICDASQGRRMASIAIIPKAGHLSVQENPDGVAQAIYAVLYSLSRPGAKANL